MRSAITAVVTCPRRLGLHPATVLPPSADGWELYAALVAYPPPGGWGGTDDDLARIVDGLRSMCGGSADA